MNISTEQITKRDSSESLPEHKSHIGDAIRAWGSYQRNGKYLSLTVTENWLAKPVRKDVDIPMYHN